MTIDEVSVDEEGATQEKTEVGSDGSLPTMSDREYRALKEEVASLTRERTQTDLRLEEIEKDKTGILEKITSMKDDIRRRVDLQRKRDTLASYCGMYAWTKLLELLRELKRHFPLLVPILHSASNYSGRDPMQCGDCKGAYENIRRRLYPSGTIGSVHTLFRGMIKLLNMKHSNQKDEDRWNYASQQCQN